MSNETKCNCSLHRLSPGITGQITQTWTTTSSSTTLYFCSGLEICKLCNQPHKKE